MTLPKGINKRGGKYRVNASQGGKRVTATANTLQDALNTRSVMQAELCIPRNGFTLQDAFNRTVQERWSRAKSGDKLAANGLRALQFFGKTLPIDQLTRTDITAYEEWMRAKGLTDATLNRRMAAVSKMLKIAYEHGWIEKLPVIHRHAEGQGRIRYLSTDEEHTLLNMCAEWGKIDHRDAIAVLLDTGMRVGELFNLEKRDLNFQHNLIHIFENKTSHPRSLPMTSRVKAILFARTVTSTKPFPFDSVWLSNVWKRIRVLMGLQLDEQFVPYACRHTCATRLLQRGMTLPELQAWLGHKTITMTMRYAHLSPTALLKGAALLEQGVSHEMYNPCVDVPVVGGVRSEPLPRMRGAEYTGSTCPEQQPSTVPGVCANTSTGHLPAVSASMGDGGPVDAVGDAERAAVEQSEHDVV